MQGPLENPPGAAGLTAERGGSPDRPEARRRPGDPRKRGSQPHPRAWQAEPRTPRLPATLQEMRVSPKTCPGFWGEGRDCVGARGRHLRGEDGAMLRGPSQLTCGGRLFWLVQLSRFCRINSFKILSSGLGLSSVAFRKCVSIRECGQIPPGRERPLTPGEAREGPSTDARWVPVPGGGRGTGRGPRACKGTCGPGKGPQRGQPLGVPGPPSPGAVASGSGEAATCVDTPLGSCCGANRVPQAQVPR